MAIGFGSAIVTSKQNVESSIRRNTVGTAVTDLLSAGIDAATLTEASTDSCSWDGDCGTRYYCCVPDDPDHPEDGGSCQLDRTYYGYVSSERTEMCGDATVCQLDSMPENGCIVEEISGAVAVTAPTLSPLYATSTACSYGGNECDGITHPVESRYPTCCQPSDSSNPEGGGYCSIYTSLNMYAPSEIVASCADTEVCSVNGMPPNGCITNTLGS